MQRIALIAAMDRARAIGRCNAMPWHLPDDLKRFKAITTGKTVLMGRKTFESIGRALPKRRNIVLTRDPRFRAEGVQVVRSFEDALEDDLMVIGGGEVYALALPIATHLHLTFVDTQIAGADAFFPEWNPLEWREVAKEHHPADDRHAFAFDWVDFERQPE